MRWRATVDWPAKRGETMMRRQWVLPPGRAPACPACCALSSTSSRWTGSSAARRSRILAATLILFFDEPRQDQRQGEHEDEHQPHAAEELEVHPVVGRIVVGDVQVERAHEGEEADPAPVQAPPDRIG